MQDIHEITSIAVFLMVSVSTRHHFHKKTRTIHTREAAVYHCTAWFWSSRPPPIRRPAATPSSAALCAPANTMTATSEPTSQQLKQASTSAMVGLLSGLCVQHRSMSAHSRAGHTAADGRGGLLPEFTSSPTRFSAVSASASMWRVVARNYAPANGGRRVTSSNSVAPNM